MAIVDPFSGEQIVGDSLVLVPFEIIPSTLLDDDPTEVESGEIVVPGGDEELVVLLSTVLTLGTPTNVIWSFSISYDGSSFFEIDSISADVGWDPITIVAASMPDARAVIKGRVVAPFFKVKAVASGTDGLNTITVVASISRIPSSVKV